MSTEEMMQYTNEEILINCLKDCAAIANTISNKKTGKTIHVQINAIISQIKGEHEDKLTEEDRVLLSKALDIAGSKRELAWQINVNVQTLLAWQKGRNCPRGSMMDALRNYVDGQRRGNRRICKNI